LKNNKGTSIIELLVVLAVIAVIAAFILPKFDTALKNRSQTTIENFNSITTRVD
jgi:prepilin-type N-terminal cleavage/methylation domain-containing protein